MKTLRFGSNSGLPFTKALRKNVNAYFKQKGISTKDNGTMRNKMIAMAAMYIIPYLILVLLPINAWLGIPLVLLMGLGMAGMGMSVMHDANHGSFSNKQSINTLLGSSIYILGGNVFTWKVQHNVLHHTFTNIEEYDEDIRYRVIIRLSPNSPLLRIHRYQYIYAFLVYSLTTLSMLSRDLNQMMKYQKMGMFEQQNTTAFKEYTKLFISKSIYLFLTIGVPLLFTSFTWWQVLTGFAIMHLFTGWILSTVFQMAHLVEGTTQPIPDSDGNIENEWTLHQLYTTSNFARNNKLLGWYIGGLNYQIEHHLFPNICHVHYPEISKIVEETAIEFGHPYNVKRSLTDALSSHIQVLKALGRKGPYGQIA